MAVFSDDDVFRFDVPMHDPFSWALPVRGYLARDFQNVDKSEWSPLRLLRKRLTLDGLGDDDEANVAFVQEKSSTVRVFGWFNCEAVRASFSKLFTRFVS